MVPNSRAAGELFFLPQPYNRSDQDVTEEDDDDDELECKWIHMICMDDRHL